MKKTLIGLIKLTRFNEYIYFVIITTLLGFAASRANLDWRLFGLVLPANWLAVGFAFMINDIEDAPDDALSHGKIRRNPVSSGLITPQTARIATYAVGILAMILYGLLGIRPLILGSICLLLGFLYSHRAVRLKTMPYVDILSHMFMLAGLQFLSAYYTFTAARQPGFLWPLAFVMAISAYGQLFNELRDLEGDREAKLGHTAIHLGEKPAQILMLIMLAIGIFSGMVTFFVVRLISGWVLAVMAVLLILFIIPAFISDKSEDSSLEIQGAFQKPLEQAAALALVFQYFLPWLDRLINLGLF